jgi:antitoxin component YwqK of YwqJK toxin-antitoxin module
MDSKMYLVTNKKEREIIRNIEGENLTYHYRYGKLDYVRSTYEKNGVITKCSFRYSSWEDSEGPHWYSEIEERNKINKDEYDYVWKSYSITMDGKISQQKLKEGIIREGVEYNHGRFKEWNISGQLLGNLTYDYDEPIGTHKRYYHNGQLKFEGSFSTNHDPLDEHVYFDIDGFINEKFIYKDGWKKYEKINYYNKSNSIKSVTSYKDGLKHGQYRHLSKDSKIIEEGKYEDGLEHGQYRHLTNDGRIIEEGKYERGKKIGNWVVNKDLKNNED